MTIFVIMLMLPLIFMASAFPLFILLTKLEEVGIAGKVFGILIGMFLLGGIMFWYQYEYLLQK